MKCVEEYVVLTFLKRFFCSILTYRKNQNKIEKDKPLIKISCDDEYKNNIYKKLIASIKYTYEIK